MSFRARIICNGPVYKAKMKGFRICDDCDFEWHSKDGLSCPLCKTRNQKEERVSGAFGTGEGASRWRIWYQTIGIIALVYLIYQLVLGGK